MTEPTDDVGVDTNVLLTLIRPDEPERSQAQDAMLALQVAGVRLVVFPQVIAEFWCVATRPKTARGGIGLSVARAQRAVLDIESRFDVLLDRSEIFDLWKDLVTRYGVVGASVHDARLVAALRAHGIKRLLTFDTGDFAWYAEIAALHPATLSPS